MSVEELKNQGNECLRNKNFKGAYDFYTKAIELDPTNYSIYSNRVLTLVELNRLDDALLDAEICVSLNSQWPKGYIRLSMVLLRLNETIKAEETALEGLKYEPENIQLNAM